MPVGAYQQLSTIADLIVRINPQKTLDVGMGFGTYGVLVREYLDLWDNANESKMYAWKRTLDGIEIFEKYITPSHRFLYDNIYIGDARAIIPTLEKHYDLVIFMDVIEHMTLADGKKLLSNILSVSGNVIVSTPKNAKEQGAQYGNEHERHISQWSEKDFKEFGDCLFIPNDGGSIICCIGTAVPRLRRELFSFKKRMHSLFPFAVLLYRKIKKAVRAIF
ncbi:MAG: class I SAM-dependent methyltransferase [Patescibacteria group bacterium]|nr:class I SAM-dependent methyltransferase [Patescibacteria group bacterium]